MYQLMVAVTFDDGDAARVWRTGNTLCMTFYALGGWTPVECYPLTQRERSTDVLTLAREAYKGDTFTLASV